jgi:AcrR family transcriptional regulator
LKFEDFRDSVRLSMEDICEELLAQNRDRIKVKKQNVAVRNLAKIFDACLRLSNEKGFASMSLRDLSREAGLSMGALYSYISSKDELLDMVQRQGRSLVFTILGEHLKEFEDPRDRLRAGIQVHLYLSEAVQPWFYFSYMETKNLPKGAHKNAIEAELFTEKLFAGIIEEGVSKGVFREVDPQMAAAALKALLQDWYLKRWKYERRRLSVEQYAHFVINFMFSHLGASEENGG